MEFMWLLVATTTTSSLHSPLCPHTCNATNWNGDCRGCTTLEFALQNDCYGANAEWLGDGSCLTGTIPSDLNTCFVGECLLGGNYITGQIPDLTKSYWSFSGFVDLSGNYLTGTLPSYLWNVTTI